MSDFTTVLDRVQGDYGFYVRLQSDPESALAEYELTADERAMLIDPKLLADALEMARPSIKITISGKHDWVNRQPKTTKSASVHAPLIAQEATLVRSAEDESARREAALRLIRLLG